MRNPIAIGAATLLVALSCGVAACGSSDDSSSSNEDVLTNTELIAQADDICAKYNDQLDQSVTDAGLNGNSPKEDITTWISDTMVPMYQDQIDELRALQPDSEDAEAYTDIIDTLESELQTIEDDPAASVEQSDPFPEATAKANDFGLEVCGAN